MSRLRQRSGQGGVALVVTLMMMSVLTMMVVGLSGVMRNEQAAARNLTYQELAGQMAEIGAREAMATLLSNSPVGGTPSVTGPGWMMTNGSLVKLFSSDPANPTVDLENSGTNSLILSVGASQIGKITVHWTNILGPGTNANAIGRYAWWIDDEGTKANLNQVGGDKNSAAATTSLLPLATNYPLSAAQFFLDDPVNGSGNNFSEARRVTMRSNAIFSPEFLKLSTNLGGIGLSANQYRSFKGNITIWSSNVDLTPWGTPKVNLNTATFDEIRQALATNALTNFFGAGTGLGRKYGGGSASATNPGNHGDLIIRQIAANILALRGTPLPYEYHTEANRNVNTLRTRHGVPSTIGSINRTPSIRDVRVKVDSRTSGNDLIVRLVVWVRLLNPYPQEFGNYSLVVRPRKFRFQISSSVDMTNTGIQVGAPLDSLPASSVYVEQGGRSIWAGPSTLSGPEQFWWPWDSGMTTNNLIIGAAGSPAYLLTNTITFSFSARPTNSTVSQAYVILDQVALYSATPATTATLVDWLTLDDLNHSDVYRNTEPDPGQFAFTGATVAPVNRGSNSFSTATNPASWTTANSIGVKRIDPQVRFPMIVWDAGDLGTLKSGGWPSGVKAWTRSTDESSNMRASSLAFLPADPVPLVPTTDFPNEYEEHPHFVLGYLPVGGFRSVAQLGAVHTGLPWRTLRFLPTPASELDQGPPDWALLDVFTVADPMVLRPMINVNSVGLDQSGKIQINGSPAHRVWAWMGAMGVLSNNYSDFFRNASISNQIASWGIPTSFSNDEQARLSTNSFTTIGPALRGVLATPENSAGWYTNTNPMLNSGWASFRSGADKNWPDQGLALRGELVETAALVQPGADLSEEQQEGRLRFFMDLLTTRSDTFTVWSAGQGLQVFTNSLGQVRTNIMGEVRKQTVFQRVPVFSGGALTGWKLQVLYSKEHRVE